MILSVVAKKIGGYVGLAVFGAGLAFGVNYCRDRSARQAIEAKPAIAANAVAIDTAKKTQVLTSTKYRSTVGGFKTFAGDVRKDPGSSPQLLACIDRGAEIISTCDARHAADTTLIALYRNRSELMEAEAVRARRGKFLTPFLAGGVNLQKLATGRVGTDLNFSDRWSVTGTFDESVRFKKDSTGKLKTSFEPSAFVGLKYSFGGRQ